MTDQPQTWRVAIWCAVSSKPQAADDKVSLQNQEEAGRQFAAAVNGQVVAVYLVPGHTRDYWSWYEAEADIPAYRQVRQALEAGDIDIVHCVDSDRLGRDPALVSQFYSLAERHHAEIYDASMPHPLGQQSTGHRYGVQVKSVSVGEDQRRRVRRHRMGMKGRIEKRGLLAGSVPFYLDPIRDPHTGATIAYQFSDQAGALDLMTRLYLGGHSYAEICRRMNASHWPPPGNGVQWWHYAIRQTLLSDLPAGIPTWGPFRGKSPSAKLPARWDPATHQAVIRERRRRAKGPYHRRGSSPLAHVAYCGRCGGRMTRHNSKRMAGYYLRCSRHALRSTAPHLACHPNHIREEHALEKVAQFLAWLTTEGALDQVLAVRGDSAEIAQMQQDLTQTLFSIENIEARKIRAGHAFAGGDMEISVYRQVNADLSQQLETQQERATRLEETLAALPDLEERRHTLEDLARTFPDLLATREPPEIATILHQAGIRVLIEDGHVRTIRIE